MLSRSGSGRLVCYHGNQPVVIVLVLVVCVSVCAYRAPAPAEDSQVLQICFQHMHTPMYLRRMPEVSADRMTIVMACPFIIKIC